MRGIRKNKNSVSFKAYNSISQNIELRFICLIEIKKKSKISIKGKFCINSFALSDQVRYILFELIIRKLLVKNTQTDQEIKFAI